MEKGGQMEIWVFAEQRGGELHKVSLELLGKAKELASKGGRVTAVLPGHDVKAISRSLINHGADRVLLADDPRLGIYRIIPYSLLLGGMIQDHRPDIFLMGATAMGVELAPRVAAKVKTGLSAHCIDLSLDSQGRLLQVVPGWGGGVVATVSCPEHRPQMATVMPGAMKALPPKEREGEIFEVAVELPDENLGPEVIEITQEKPQGLPLEKAEVVVAGGWGIGSRENWQLIQELASLLGGAVGATRPPVDEGWALEGQMIGQSGKTIRPRLYIGIGISGVMHHVVGMEGSDHIIAINSDPNAEIFETADVIVVEDFKKIIPPLIREIKNRLKKQGSSD